ncbi:MAG: hypothetical protein A2231_10030 [Candidatus Firestonebacteria bacterium RIFOXYA2_FULL_40_8]|nr:MAG: hypothetical protein A2231_10030 [Candidatus Firestonebacteria bacterium RIFOXYA2_FULL_40_8]
MLSQVDKKSNIPLYIQLAESIKKEVKDGELGPNYRLPFMEDICKELTVSMTTVRKAMDILQEDGIVYKIKGTGTFIKGSIEAIKKENISLKDICFLSRNAIDLESDSFYSEIYKGIFKVARENNINVIISTCNPNKLPDIKNIGGVFALEIDDERYLNSIAESGIPVVVGDYILSLSNCDYVTYDIYKGARMLIKTLIDKGHREIVYLGGMIRTPYGRSIAENGNGIRLNTINEVIERSETKINLTVYSTTIGIHASYDLTKEILKQEHLPTAIFAFDDAVAEGVISCLQDNKIKVPEDISVVGMGGYKNRRINKKITSFSYENKKMGEITAERLIQRMLGDVNAGFTMLIDGKFIPGETVASAKDMK